MTRGVKQGDPLSPLLFNLVLDELLTSLPSDIGFQLGPHLINGLGFADDVILVSASKPGMDKLLQHASDFFKSRSLALNSKKSFALRLIPSTKNRIVVPDRRASFLLSNEPLRLIDQHSTFTYLGINFDPSGKLSLNLKLLSDLLLKLRKAPLKPQQKLSLLKSNILPRFAYRLTLGRLTIGLLERFDTLVRQFVKDLLRLGHDTPDSGIHASVKDGGLGVPSMTLLVPSSLIRRLSKLDRSSDPIVSSLMSLGFLPKLLEKCQSILTRFGPLDPTSSYSHSWGKLWHTTTDGRPTSDFSTHSFGQSWLLAPAPYLTGREFCELTKLRLGRLETRVTSSRGRPTVKSCRFCNALSESVNHISQSCYATHGLRIRRHNKLLSKLTSILKPCRDLQLFVEPRIITPQALFKPDLIIVSSDSILVVDMIVTGDGPGALKRAADAKILKYDTSEFNNHLRSLHGAKKVTHMPFVMSCRGCYWTPNDRILDLAKAKSRRSEFVHASMSWTIKIWKFFCML
jgi:hypothetical protein